MENPEYAQNIIPHVNYTWSGLVMGTTSAPAHGDFLKSRPRIAMAGTDKIKCQCFPPSRVANLKATLSHNNIGQISVFAHYNASEVIVQGKRAEMQSSFWPYSEETTNMISSLFVCTAGKTMSLLSIFLYFSAV